jgi:hypothetical protein
MATTAKTSSRRVLLYIWLAAAFTAVAYTVYWAVAADRIRTEATTALGGVRGLAHEGIGVSGWPYRHTLTIEKPSYETAEGLALAADRLVLSASSLDPHLWALAPVENASIGFPRGPRRPVSFGGLDGSLRLSRSGLVRLSLVARAAQARPVQAEDRGWTLGAGELHLVADQAKPGRYGLALSLSDLRLAADPEGPAAILGDTLARVVLRGPIDGTDGLVRSPRAWQQAGGGFEVMIGELDWGPLRLRDSRGRLAPDGQGRWQGEISTTGAVVPAGLAFDALSRPVDAAIRDGVLRAFGLPLLRLPDAF